jgi:hypothetical protein
MSRSVEDEVVVVVVVEDTPSFESTVNNLSTVTDRAITTGLIGL